MPCLSSHVPRFIFRNLWSQFPKEMNQAPLGDRAIPLCVPALESFPHTIRQKGHGGQDTRARSGSFDLNNVGCPASLRMRLGSDGWWWLWSIIYCSWLGFQGHWLLTLPSTNSCSLCSIFTQIQIFFKDYQQTAQSDQIAMSERNPQLQIDLFRHLECSHPSIPRIPRAPSDPRVGLYERHRVWTGLGVVNQTNWKINSGMSPHMVLICSRIGERSHTTQTLPLPPIGPAKSVRPSSRGWNFRSSGPQ